MAVKRTRRIVNATRVKGGGYLDVGVHQVDAKTLCPKGKAEGTLREIEVGVSEREVVSTVYGAAIAHTDDWEGSVVIDRVIVENTLVLDSRSQAKVSHFLCFARAVDQDEARVDRIPGSVDILRGSDGDNYLAGLPRKQGQLARVEYDACSSTRDGDGSSSRDDRVLWGEGFRLSVIECMAIENITSAMVNAVPAAVWESWYFLDVWPVLVMET
jgi:hypothetical protein